MYYNTLRIVAEAAGRRGAEGSLRAVGRVAAEARIESDI